MLTSTALLVFQRNAIATSASFSNLRLATGLEFRHKPKDRTCLVPGRACSKVREALVC